MTAVKFLSIAWILALGAGIPNIVLILTDDQDHELDGMQNMPKTLDAFSTGAKLTNYFVTTPVCCPSRTAMLAGVYSHNLDNQNQGWCGNFSAAAINATFAVPLHESGYQTGLFGKFVNSQCGEHKGEYFVPVGWDRWYAMCSDNKYFDNKMNDQGIETRLEPGEYLTAAIGNRSMDWLREVTIEPAQPFFAFIAPHACHVPATPAPWYIDALPNLAPSTSLSSAYDDATLGHHWLVSQLAETPMNGHQKWFTEQLHRYRQQSLLSVDDLVHEVMTLLISTGVIDNTYVIFTSDHGYSLGEMRLPSGKYHLFENDVRAPFFARGPEIQSGDRTSLAANIDLFSTIVDLAGLEPPHSSDGTSLVPVLKTPFPVTGWRDRLLLEYWGCCTAQGSYVWRGGCECNASYPNACGVSNCGHPWDALLDAPSNTWSALRVINTTANLLYGEYRGRTDPVTSASTNFSVLFDLTVDPLEQNNLLFRSRNDKKVKVPGMGETSLAELSTQLWSLVECQGSSCRNNRG